MNVRPDVMRQGNMLGGGMAPPAQLINGGPYIMQPGQGQQPLSQMGMIPTGGNGGQQTNHASMNMLPMQTAQRQQMHQQQQQQNQQVQQQRIMRSQQMAAQQGINPMNQPAANTGALGMAFPSNVIINNNPRRVVSQPGNFMSQGGQPGTMIGINPQSQQYRQAALTTQQQQQNQQNIQRQQLHMQQQHIVSGHPDMLQMSARPAPIRSNQVMQSFQNNLPPPSSSPRPPSHAPMPIPGPSQPQMNRARTTPDNTMYMGFQNSPQFQPGPSQNPGNRVNHSSSFPFVPTSSPPHELTPQPPNRMGNASIPPGNGPFHAHQPPFEPMHGENERFEAHHFNGMPPPTRPLSHSNNNTHSVPLHEGQHPMSMSPIPHQRPPSQPPRPPSQTGSSQTPRLQLLQPPANGRLPPSMQHAPQQIAPRQPVHVNAVASSSTSGPVPPTGNLNPSEEIDVFPAGQGLQHLLRFSGMMASDNYGQKLSLKFWDELIYNYFMPKAVMKFTLWKDGQRSEAKPFEIGRPILPRFFLVTTQSGVQSMSLVLDGARERQFDPGHCVIECLNAAWTYKYSNGYTVTLRGPLTCHVIACSPARVPGATPTAPSQPSGVMYKFDDFQFDALTHEKLILVDHVQGARESHSPKLSIPSLRNEDNVEGPRISIRHATMPGEPVNAFGIPQETMRCLELAESVGQMSTLIAYATEKVLGPKDALTNFAAMIRETHPTVANQALTNANSVNPFHQFPNGTAPTNGINGINGMPSTTLYTAASTPPTGGPPTPSQQQHSPQNLPPSAVSSPQKQHKSIPAPAVLPTTANTPTATGSASSTPALSNASLKRKQNATESTTEQPPPAKRATRKRRATGAAAS